VLPGENHAAGQIERHDNVESAEGKMPAEPLPEGEVVNLADVRKTPRLNQRR
jgi:hypothetical protein